VERASAEAYVLELYKELLARIPPEPEREGWIDTLVHGATPGDIRDAITGSQEYVDRRRITAERDAIARTGLFDADFYVQTYPDVAEAGVDPLDHYTRFGRAEGRQANPYLVDHWYRERTGIASASDAVLDYARRGEALGLPPGPNFDPVWYQDAYRLGDQVSPLAHFLASRRIGRFAPCPRLWSVANAPVDPTTPPPADPFLPWLAGAEDFTAGASADVAVLAGSGVFDANHYLVANHDVMESDYDPLLHFCLFGWTEARNPNAYFDTTWYTKTNPEVARLRVNPLVHYLLVGERQNRRPVVYFEPSWYRETYGLAKDASPLAHFLANRHAQVVSPNSLFDPQWFIAQSGRKVNRRLDPFAYYLFAGTWNDLQPSPTFDAIAWRKRRRGRRSRHFPGLQHPDKDNPLVDYLLSSYR
jgi:hypothetical protein